MWTVTCLNNKFYLSCACASVAQSVKWSFLRYLFTWSWVRISGNKTFFFPIDLKTISFTETYESVVIFKFPRRSHFYVFNINNARVLNTKYDEACMEIQRR